MGRVDVHASIHCTGHVADLLAEYVRQMHDESVTDEHIASTIADGPVQVE